MGLSLKFYPTIIINFLAIFDMDIKAAELLQENNKDTEESTVVYHALSLS